MSKNVILKDKNGNQLYPASTAEQVSYNGQINVKQAIDRFQGSPLVALYSGDMTDTSRVYVYTGSEAGYTSGNWYYYDGSDWVSGGVYNAVAVSTDTTLTESGVPADAKATGDAISAIGGVSGLTQDIKTTLLACFAHVAWTDDDGQDYYDALNLALNPPSELVSISAVYTQTETVTPSTDLNSLKSDLVVTALYANSSTEVLNASAYTLSGTLAVGTSTVTVTYSDKTTTFNVTVSTNIPSAYTQYDYIASPGGTNINQSKVIFIKQYADLNALSWDLLFKATSSVASSGGAIFGARSASGSSKSVAGYCNGSGVAVHSHGVDTGFQQSITANALNHVEYINTASSPSSYKVNDATATSIAWNNSNVLNIAPSMMANFQYGSTSTKMFAGLQLNELKFYNLSGDLVGDYVPVVRTADNVIGMFDIVEQEFYTATDTTAVTSGASGAMYSVGNWS